MKRFIIYFNSKAAKNVVYDLLTAYKFEVLDFGYWLDKDSCGNFDGNGEVSKDIYSHYDSKDKKHRHVAFQAETEFGKLIEFLENLNPKPVIVKLNSEYNAEITDKVKVGCQEFEFDVILKLAKEVEKRKKEINK